MHTQPARAVDTLLSARPDGRTVVTYSSLRTYRACARKYYFQYVLGVRSLSTSRAAGRGNWGHKIAETYWKGRQKNAADPTALALRVVGEIDDPMERALMRPLMAGYCGAWDPYNARVGGVEKTFESPLRDPSGGVSDRFVVQGKIDLYFDLGGMRAVLTEHKLTALDPTLGSDYRRRLVIDEQIDTYWMGAESFGVAIDRVGYDVIRFPTIKPFAATPPEDRRYTQAKFEPAKYTKARYSRRSKAHPERVLLEEPRMLEAARLLEPSRLYAGQHERDETPDEFEQRLAEDIARDPSRYYERFRVDRLPHERRRFRLNLWDEAKRLAHSMDHDAWPTNSDSCFRFGTPCEFFAVCAEGASLDDPTRYRRVETMHTELR
jgi:hypothetical protein